MPTNRIDLEREMGEFAKENLRGVFAESDPRYSDTATALGLVYLDSWAMQMANGANIEYPSENPDKAYVKRSYSWVI